MIKNNVFNIIYEDCVLPSIEKLMKRNRVFYVKDRNEKWKGGVGRREYTKYLSTGVLEINSNFIKVYVENAERSARELFRYNAQLKEIPVLDSDGRMLYELRRDGYDDVKYYIDSLRKQGCTIGKNCYIVNSYIDVQFGELITIGDRVTITGSSILAHDASTQLSLGYSKIGKVEIGSEVFISYKSIVLPNTTIGNKVIVGAGTVVRSDVPDNSVVIGNPMKIVSSYDEYVEKQKKFMDSSLHFDKFFRELTVDEKTVVKQSYNFVYVK